MRLLLAACADPARRGYSYRRASWLVCGRVVPGGFSGVCDSHGLSCVVRADPLPAVTGYPCIQDPSYLKKVTEPKKEVGAPSSMRTTLKVSKGLVTPSGCSPSSMPKYSNSSSV